ncbi:hypothetical protein KM043_013894 [Ampulex compressa]|nr:hypothetical protein KM043_013894 [Ampulex compressa]
MKKRRRFLEMLLITHFSCFLTVEALQLLRLHVPGIVDPKEKAISLKCEYDLEGKELYSVKWYKDGSEFYSFTPGMEPPIITFPVDGVQVDVRKSGSTRVTIFSQKDESGGTVSLSGSYGCEVSTEGPTFLTAYGVSNMTVAIHGPPRILGVQASYKLGDNLRAECISARSYPPAELLFFLNENEVPMEQSSNQVDKLSDQTSISRLLLILRLERHHFPGGILRLVCRSTLPDISSHAVLETLETATLAASKQRFAQEPPRSSSSFTSSFFHLIFGQVVLVSIRERNG